MRIALAIALLSALFVITVGELEPADLALGAAAGALALWLTRGLKPDPGAEPELPPLHRQLAAIPPWLVVVAREVITGTILVAKVTLRPSRAPRAGFVEIPIGGRSRRAISVSSLLITLSPGELVVDLDHEREVMLVHMVDASDPDAARERHRRIYERYQRRVIP